MKLRWIFFVCTFFSSILHAYVPPYWMILSRTAENHGRGIYRVEQVVEFESDGQKLEVKEIWHIKDDNELRLEVIGLGSLQSTLRLEFVYRQGKRFHLDSNKKTKSYAISNSFSEPYFYFRNVDFVKKDLVAKKIAPPSSLTSTKLKNFNASTKLTEENFVKLDRSEGKVAYRVGSKDLSFWVEQDQFHTLQVNFSDQRSVSARNYEKHARGLWLPKLRNYKFLPYRAEIKLLKVTPLSNSQKNMAIFHPTSLTTEARLPASPIIKEFYTQMR